MPANDKPGLPRDACYFLTLNIVDKIDVFVRPAYKQVIADSLNYFIAAHEVVVYAWCLMSSHLHLMIKTAKGTGPAHFEKDFKKHTTPEIIQTIEMEMDFRREWMIQRFERFSASLRRIEKFQVWQNCSSPLHIDHEQPGMLMDRIEHIHDNPVRERIVDLAESYLYSSARDYAGLKGLVNVKVIQQQGLSRAKLLSSN
jgi:REP element-mobilizing transposase RayT